jgi:hypothetical protein
VSEVNLTVVLLVVANCGDGPAIVCGPSVRSRPVAPFASQFAKVSYSLNVRFPSRSPPPPTVTLALSCG